MSKRPASPNHLEEDASEDAQGQTYSPTLSKTQLKKQMQDLQELGEQLAELSEEKLVTINLPDRLMDAVRELKRTRSHEGRRRQLQYVGKMMRLADADPIREALAAFKIGHAKDTLDLHRAERWRAELIADDDALTRWADDHPGSDLQQLRNLIRAARKDAALEPEKRNGRGFRELYQFVKQSLAQAASSSDSATESSVDESDDD